MSTPVPVTHTIFIFATTADPHPLSMKNDGDSNWESPDNFTTLVNAGDTVIWNFTHKKGNTVNDISKIQNITPVTFFEPSHSPNKNNNWTGIIKTGNPKKGEQPYNIKYRVKDAENNPYTQDPKLQMKS